MSNSEFIASFIVARGEVEASPRGHGELHILLADRLSQRLGAEVAVGDYASGDMLLRDGNAVGRLNRLPRGVAEAQVLRLVGEEFGDLGDVALDIGSGKMHGEVDLAWRFEWRDGCQGRALMTEPCSEAARLFSWCPEDEGVPVFHLEAMEWLGLSDAVSLAIDPDGTCQGYFLDNDPELRGCVAAALPRLDPRLRLRDPNEPEGDPYDPESWSA